MKSPYAPYDEAELIEEKNITVFRGEEYEYVDYYYRDPQGREFTTAEIGDKGLTSIYDQYRIKHNIPSSKEIQALRKRLGLSCAKMSMILGFGPNQYRLYEKGTLPNESNGKLLSLLCHCNEAVKYYITNSQQILSEKETDFALQALDAVKDKE